MTPEPGRSRARGAALVVSLLVVAAVAGFLLGRAGGTDTPAVGTPSAADVGFAQDMAVHHEQAILMASLALDRARPTVRAIAEAILTNQGQEIGLLRGWLRLWGQPAVSPHPMAWMMTGSSMAGMDMSAGSTAMPGMATPDQLQRLYQLRGKQFDVLFLQLMIRHHQGGLLMADAVLKAPALAVTHAAAQAMSAEQIEDLGTMRALLANDGAKQLPPPA